MLESRERRNRRGPEKVEAKKTDKETTATMRTERQRTQGRACSRKRCREADTEVRQVDRQVRARKAVVKKKNSDTMLVGDVIKI